MRTTDSLEIQSPSSVQEHAPLVEAGKKLSNLSAHPSGNQGEDDFAAAEIVSVSAVAMVANDSIRTVALPAGRTSVVCHLHCDVPLPGLNLVASFHCCDCTSCILCISIADESS